MHILHLSADYPDPLNPAKTKAVANLLAMAQEHTHRVMSLNRIGWRLGIRALDFADAAGQGHRAVAYGAPPKGLFHERFLLRLADWIADDCAAAGIRPDLIHAHKLTIEGIAGDALARRWGVPLALSVQGNTDLKIARAKPGLHPVLTRIWQEADVAFPFAPWAWTDLDDLLGRRGGPTHALPCPGPADILRAPAQSTEPVVLSAFHLHDAANKNAVALIDAIAIAAKDVPEIRLEILGGGDAVAFARLACHADKAAPGRVRFLGHVPQAEIQDLFNRATAFALVSHRESYGMVFAEALLAGTPCLIPHGRAIDGYFEDGSVVIAADPKDTPGIARGLVRLLTEEAAFKTHLAALGAQGGLDFLRRDAIQATYLGALAQLDRVT